MNILKEKINRGEPLRGTHVSLSDPSICTILGRIGFDYIWVDMEHTYIDCKTLYIHLTAARSVGASVIVRVPQNDLITLKRVMEMGVDGVIFPMVRSVEQAKELIGATFYPPRGHRGFGPRDAVQFGLADVSEYIEKGSLEMCRFIQIEHKDAVEHIEELAEIDGIDGYIFGPFDLSGSVGRLGYPYEQPTAEVMKRATEILRKNGKYVGVSMGDFHAETARYFSDMGISMISLGADTDYLIFGAQEAYKNLHEDQKG